MTERVAIVGSRAHPRLSMVREYVFALPAGTLVISGGAVGVDSTVSMAAANSQRCGLKVHLPIDMLPVSRKLSNRDRLLWRNTLIALDCDRMVVFPDGSSGGCWDAAREAVRFGRPVEVRWCDGRVVPFVGSKKHRRRVAGEQLEGLVSE